MKALLQRVKEARVDVDGQCVGRIGGGFLVLLCAERGDTEKDIQYVVKKVTNLRVFEDNKGKMNLSIKEVGGEFLVVSQFTLAADVRKGNRPSFDMAESPERAEKLYNLFIEDLRSMDFKVETGRFGSYMEVYLINDGPVTIMVDSRY